MKNLVIFLLLTISASFAYAYDINTLDWGVVNQKKLNESLDLKEQVQILMRKILPNSDMVPPTVGEAIFVDLDGDGVLELLATVDYSGRSFFVNLVIVQKTHGKIGWSELRGNGVSIENIADRIIDINGDGRKEIVIDQNMGDYKGADRVPQETLIFLFQSGRIYDVSNSFPGYYRDKIIPGLERRLDKVKNSASTSIQSMENPEASMVNIELKRAKQRGMLN